MARLVDNSHIVAAAMGPSVPEVRKRDDVEDQDHEDGHNEADAADVAGVQRLGTLRCLTEFRVTKIHPGGRRRHPAARSSLTPSQAVWISPRAKSLSGPFALRDWRRTLDNKVIEASIQEDFDASATRPNLRVIVS